MKKLLGILILTVFGTVGAWAQGGGQFGGATSGNGGVTPSGTLTLNQLIVGNGASGVKADTGCSTDGAGNLTCVSMTATGALKTGTGCTPAGGTATGGVCMTEGTSTGWTPTAGFDYIRADSTAHAILCSYNGGAEGACIGQLTAANTHWFGYTVFSPPPLGTSGGTGVIVANNPALFLFTLPVVAKVTNDSIFVATGTAATFADSGMYSTAGTLLWHTGSVSTSGTNSAIVTAVSGGAVTLQPGNYYLAFCDSSATPTFMPITSSGSNMRTYLGGASISAHTFGTDTNAGDNCTAGVLPASITIANIVNSSSIDVPSVEMLN